MPLRQLYLRGQGQSIARLLPYLRQMTSALEYAHTQGRIHKHLRPDNVLLTPNDTIHLCDFAIDGLATNELFQNYQRRKLSIEPLAYMAPEQIQQQPVPASDQYALATMIYEWLCGAPPFLGAPSEIAQQQLHRAPSGIRQKVSGISPDIEEVIMMALLKEPGRRFSSVGAFMNALEQAYAPLQPADQHRPSHFASAHVTPPILARHPTEPIFMPAPFQPITASDAPTIANLPDTGPSFAQNAPQFSASGTQPPARRQQKSGKHTRRALLASAASVAIVGGVGSWLLWSRLQPHTTSISTSTDTPTSVSHDQPIVYRTHTARVNAVAWSPDGQKVASGSDDKLVLICDRTGKTLLTYSGHTGHVNAVAWSPDGQYIASGGADKTVQIWDATSGTLVFTYTGHSAAVNAVAWFPDPTDDRLFVASGSDDKTAQAWFGTTGEQFLNYPLHSAEVTCVAWSPDTLKLASGSWDTELHVCSTINNDAFRIGDEIFSFKGHTKEINAIAWSPDGTRIASAGGDNVVQVCNGIDGSSVDYPFRQHGAPVQSVAWSPDGNSIVSGSDDKTARVWDATTGVLTFAYKHHSDAILSLAWLPDSTLVASGSADTTVQLWKPS